ncbi:hypothetical protein EBR25_14030 [bacterium]|nr:hypothetical protein [bacterium]
MSRYGTADLLPSQEQQVHQSDYRRCGHPDEDECACAEIYIPDDDLFVAPPRPVAPPVPARKLQVSFGSDQVIEIEPYLQSGDCQTAAEHHHARRYTEFVEERGNDSGYEYCDVCRGIVVDDECACGHRDHEHNAGYYERDERHTIAVHANAVLESSDCAQQIECDYLDDCDGEPHVAHLYLEGPLDGSYEYDDDDDSDDDDDDSDDDDDDSDDNDAEQAEDDEPAHLYDEDGPLSVLSESEAEAAEDDDDEDCGPSSDREDDKNEYNAESFRRDIEERAHALYPGLVDEETILFFEDVVGEYWTEFVRHMCCYFPDFRSFLISHLDMTLDERISTIAHNGCKNAIDRLHQIEEEYEELRLREEEEAQDKWEYFVNGW